jgi:hypothetical protein
MKWLIIPLCLIFFFLSCIKDRDLSDLQRVTDTIAINTGIIKINEFVAKGSANINEYGMTSDWFELYNTSNESISMANGRWYVTDNLASPRKYAMPAATIKPHGFLVVWCDGMNKYAKQIHSNFNLSASGEQIGIFFSITDQILLVVDSLTYPLMTEKGFSYGRLPDGSNNWTYFAKPTPGEQNHY